jgi:hypothetical protein
MKILADVDGVLLNWEDSFHAWMAAKGFAVDNKESYEIFECYKGVSEAEMHGLIQTFNASATMGFLPPIKDAVPWVDKMYFKHGVTFHCITSMGSDPHAQSLRRMNLNRHFVNVDDLTILPCGADKTDVLKKYEGSGLIWLEDNIKNAVLGANLGLKVYLFNRSYNQETDYDPWFTRVDNWKQLYENIFPTDK